MECCAQYLMTDIDIDVRYACLFFGRQVAPGGYAWVFPKGPSSANVGLGISGDFGGERHALSYLKAFVDQRFPAGAVVRATAGGVPCSGGLKQIVADGVMLVGDAAHQANPMSGGGVINALKAARIAGRVAAEAIWEGNVSSKRLGEYQKEWDRLLGRVHRSFYRIKESVFGLSDDQFNRIAGDLNALAREKRTLPRAFMIALKNQPKLVSALAEALAGELLHHRSR
jgi:digeranylgeranylglycerophospholipid reductase